jgi:hypothetical protein
LFFHAASSKREVSNIIHDFGHGLRLNFMARAKKHPACGGAAAFVSQKEAARTHSMSAVRRAYYINDDVFLPSPSSTTISLSTRALTGQERKIPGTKKETATGQPAVKQIKT